MSIKQIVTCDVCQGEVMPDDHIHAPLGIDFHFHCFVDLTAIEVAKALNLNTLRYGSEILLTYVETLEANHMNNGLYDGTDGIDDD